MNRNRIIIVTLAFITAAFIFTQGGAKPARSQRRVIGYFMSVTPSKSEYVSARRSASVLTHLCPTRVQIEDTDGKVVFGKDNYIISFAKQHHIALLPLVTNGDFSKEIGHAVLSDPAKRTKVVSQLLDVCRAWRAPGINVDLENIDPTDRQNLNAFMKELCDRFHEKGLSVTIDVAAKTRDAPEAVWAGVYDYKFLGECCDLVMLMCYDEHWGGGSPGPIGSKPWVRKVLEYATGVIPPHKVILGVPFYGCDWPDGGGRGRSVTCARVDKLIAAKKPWIQWDNEAKCKWFRYQDDEGKKRTVYYESRESLKHRIALAQEFKVGGISIWRLGGEDPAFWKLLAMYRRGGRVLR